ncbi:CPBP family intramembrane glutamic endopeptidase [Rhabdochromatium marinum]|uniref:CPBP family intramembrane glutamic endopeptidase n=1 Tax=Rhabdochromatium marinum TaxID=48729 RepID=UPI0019056258|nr:CPBP family intramembrane glutamic endopeptidase [Rhabdochromatium marinum]MBK1647150.1 CPBP family intramembrane metalloprotease domain-containing protein [Rhabdochromatium marinum]
MRPTALFFAYMLGSLLLAAVFSAPLLQNQLIDAEPQRILARLAQVIMLLGLWPFLHWLRLDHRTCLGFDQARRVFGRKLMLGWCLGTLMMGSIVALLLLSGARVFESWEPSLPLELAQTALRALIAGLLIALLEETFFRGALFAALRRRHSLWSAASWSAALYALVHFMKPQALPAGMVADWSGIAWMLGSLFAGPLQLHHLDSLLALWLAGLLLALVRERSGSLALGIGLHAGWVFVIQVSRRLSDGVETAPWSWLAGDYDGVIGLLAAVVLGLIIATERLSLRRHRSEAATVPEPLEPLHAARESRKPG